MNNELKIQERESFGKIAEISPLSGGIVNSSFMIRSDKGKFVLQKEADGLGGITASDYMAIEDHLKKSGLQIPKLVDHWKGEGGSWRVMEFIDHVPIERPRTLYAIAAAKTLRLVHESLASCNLIPSRTIEDFHDSAAIFAKLEAYLKDSYSAEINSLAGRVLEEGRRLSVPNGNRQLIHGDPKWKNFLFGPVICEPPRALLIDWDTLMIGSPLIDLGDMARSFCNSGNRFDTEKFKILCLNYRIAGAGVFVSDDEALKSTRLITLELAARFLVDCFEDRYFGWDKSRFRTRFASNLSSAEKYVTYFMSMPGSI